MIQAYLIVAVFAFSVLLCFWALLGVIKAVREVRTINKPVASCPQQKRRAA